MRRSAALAFFLSFLLLACGERSGKPKPLSVPGEKLYALEGKILGRDAASNLLRIDHKAIPGYMEAMVMEYPVRGAEVQSLPADQSNITAKVHVTESAYWLTDVRKVP